MSTVSQTSLWSCTLQNMPIKLIESVNFQEAHIENHLFNWNFCSQVVTDHCFRCESKQGLARILLIESTTIINVCTCRLNVTKNAHLWCHKSPGVLLSIKSRCEMQTAIGTLKNHIYSSLPSFLLFFLLPYQTTCHCRKALKKEILKG